MVTAIVLMQVEPGPVDEIARQLSQIDGVAEVYSIAGEWDLVAILRVPRTEALANLVTEKLSRSPGVVSTETLIAFRAYSRYDLDRMFSVGTGS